MGRRVTKALNPKLTSRHTITSPPSARGDVTNVRRPIYFVEHIGAVQASPAIFASAAPRFTSVPCIPRIRDAELIRGLNRLHLLALEVQSAQAEPVVIDEEHHAALLPEGDEASF